MENTHNKTCAYGGKCQCNGNGCDCNHSNNNNEIDKEIAEAKLYFNSDLEEHINEYVKKEILSHE